MRTRMAQFAKPRYLWVIAGVLALSGGAFAIGRIAGEGGSVGAGPGDGDATATDTAPIATPEPGATPDTSVPGWWVPYVLEDEQRPQFDQVINGILIGPTVQSVGSCRVDGEFPLDIADGSRVAIVPRNLPDGAVGDGRAATCDGEPTAAEANYYIPPDEADMRRVEAGEITYFEAQHGGSLRITRSVQVGQPTHQIQGIPAERFGEAMVAGHTAAIGRPLFEEGWGLGVVAVWDADASVLTVVQGSDFTSEELIRIAEGVLQ